MRWLKGKNASNKISVLSHHLCSFFLPGPDHWRNIPDHRNTMLFGGFHKRHVESGVINANKAGWFTHAHLIDKLLFGIKEKTEVFYNFCKSHFIEWLEWHQLIKPLCHHFGTANAPAFKVRFDCMQLINNRCSMDVT